MFQAGQSRKDSDLSVTLDNLELQEAHQQNLKHDSRRKNLDITVLDSETGPSYSNTTNLRRISSAGNNASDQMGYLSTREHSIT